MNAEVIFALKKVIVGAGWNPTTLTPFIVGMTITEIAKWALLLMDHIITVLLFPLLNYSGTFSSILLWKYCITALMVTLFQVDVVVFGRFNYLERATKLCPRPSHL